MMDGQDEHGVTLVELVVAMTIMSIFMSIFTAVAVQMFKFESDTESATSAKTQIHLAFLRLDREIRYASGISTPTSAFVEYVRTDTHDPLCSELWLDPASKALRTRSWTQGTTPASNWITLATDATATTPFTLFAAAPPYTTQRLNLTITIGPNGGNGPSRVMNATFTAQNTTTSTSSGTVCTEGRLVP
jgi:prepilin-type N-terminal cleavage/methylation domain-containing protein